MQAPPWAFLRPQKGKTIYCVHVGASEDFECNMTKGRVRLYWGTRDNFQQRDRSLVWFPCVVSKGVFQGELERMGEICSCFDVMCSEYLRKSTIRLLILSKVHVNWTTFTDTFVYSHMVCLCTYGHPKGLSEGWGSPWKQIKEHVRGIRSRAHLQLKSPTTSTKWVHKLRTNFHMIAVDYNIQFGFNESWQPLCFFPPFLSIFIFVALESHHNVNTKLLPPTLTTSFKSVDLPF